MKKSEKGEKPNAQHRFKKAEAATFAQAQLIGSKYDKCRIKRIKDGYSVQECK